MKYNFFVDETWDHSLSHINQDFPYFLLCGILISDEENKKLNEQVNKLKIDFFWTTEVILHSRDIRKCEKAFKILFDLEIKEKFYDRLNQVIKDIDFQIISIWIKKEQYIKKYWKTAINPYQISLSYMLERVIFCIWNDGHRCDIFVEKRGKKEDKELLEYYNQVNSLWTYYVKSSDMRKCIWKFDFRWKYKNDVWIQLADLCAYPLVSYMRNNREKNPAFEIIKPKIYQKSWRLYGFKTHP
jgi:hypothetical protein